MYKNNYSLNETKCIKCFGFKTLYFFLVFIFFISCSSKKQADLLVTNAVIYTVDSAFSVAQCIAIKDGRFIAIGSSDLISDYQAKEIIDAQGKAIYPGFIDSHCHFYGYGKGLQEINLVGTKSFEEVLQKVKDQSSKIPAGSWIIGRGWDQNDWEVKEFPDRYELDKLFPNTPVFLQRIDGHAALANAEALKRATIVNDTKVAGGIIEIDLITKENSDDKKWLAAENKELGQIKFPIAIPSGILIDNAVDLVQKAIPKPSKADIINSLIAAEKNCFAVGLTTVDDAGLEKNIVDVIDELQKNNKLKMRVYAMLTDNKENFNYYLKNGPYKTERLNVRSFKFYADGALGSRGACLLKPYSDKPEESGFLLNNPEYFDSLAKVIFDKGFQMNTHCIGDSAVRLISTIYLNNLFGGKAVNNSPLAYRWRIEHAQVVDPKDVNKFSDIIPSVQPTHATSDMYWAKERLGEQRVKCAYAYNDLLKACGKIALGTDFPVENINPLFTFYAAVARKDLKDFPVGGFQSENALSPENTLRGMTIWGAFANFEEKEKGSIEIGKMADFVVLDKDIIKCDISEVPKTKVIYTFVNGECVYR
jgi:predicted amidohydrolase YtcJ